jgi:hypothetical protein
VLWFCKLFEAGPRGPVEKRRAVRPGVQTMADDANVGGLGDAVENMKAKMKDAPPKAAPPKKEGIV